MTYALTPGQQVFGMRAEYPSFRSRWKRGRVTWTGSVQPLPISETYQIEVTFTLEEGPKVFVQNPALCKRSSSEPIPHLYNDGSLCLFYPPGEEWHPSRHVSRTTIPWTVLWLAYYETWHATGTWFGGGIHPRGRR